MTTPEQQPFPLIFGLDTFGDFPIGGGQREVIGMVFADPSAIPR